MVKQETSFSFEAITELCALNSKLSKMTGVDFAKQLVALANNDKKTEIDARDFIKNNYPAKIINEQDSLNITLLIDFYLYWVNYKDSESEITYCYCQPKENPDEKPFRSRCLGHFINDPLKLSFVTGFFSKD
jgi:hypothetical protein